MSLKRCFFSFEFFQLLFDFFQDKYFFDEFKFFSFYRNDFLMRQLRKSDFKITKKCNMYFFPIKIVYDIL